MLNLQAGGEEQLPAMLRKQRPLRQHRGRALGSRRGPRLVSAPWSFTSHSSSRPLWWTRRASWQALPVSWRMQRVQTASAGRETSRTCAGRRSASGFGSAPGSWSGAAPPSPRGSRPRAGEDDPTAESPAAGVRPGQRISDDAVGAIDPGQGRASTAARMRLAPRSGDCSWGPQIPKRQVFAEVGSPRVRSRGRGGAPRRQPPRFGCRASARAVRGSVPRSCPTPSHLDAPHTP